LIPHEESWLAKMLVRIEESYYRKIVLPEILIVIRLDPEIAVQRKTEEKPDIVRERSLEILSADWQGTNANVIDGSRPQAEVLADLKAYIWSQL
jgi:thymidylate kinase